MEENQTAPRMNLQMLKNLSRKDKFVNEAWKEEALNDTHGGNICSSLGRYDSYSSSPSGLEVETGFMMDHDIGNCTRSQALRWVFDRSSKSPNKIGSPARKLLRERRIGKMNCDIAPTLCSPYRFFNGSANCSSDSSCNSICSKEISISCSFSSDESYDKDLIMDSINASKNRKHKNQRTFAFIGRKNKEKHPLHSLINQECRGMVTDLDQIVRKHEEIHFDLSQKYRPKSFKDFIGQNIVRKYLMNAILKRKIAPIYLFYGPRGTGKSSAARIFASALNCLSPTRKLKPCCKCRECCLCLSGKSPHVIELNVAGTDAGEKLKLCLEAVKSNNVTSGYRVFIIEDCHELSPEAWNNVILKCMENAMACVVFILITVDLEWVPKTAISRCQKFYFQKLRDADMFNMLKNIAAAEKINIEENALRLITARAGGSLRDAEMALEQISLLSSTVTVSRVRQTIGLLPDENLLHLLEFALSGDKDNTLRCTREIIDCGVQPLALVTRLATLVKDVLINSCLSTEAQETQYLFEMPYSCINRTEKLGRALKILSEAEKQLRVSDKCISWLTAALLQFGSVELNSDSHSTVDIEVNEMDSACEDKTSHYTNQWNLYDAPDTNLLASKTKTIGALKDSGIADSLDRGYEFAQNLTSPICNLDMTKSVHLHDIEVNDFPVISPSLNCTSETGKLDLNPMSPCKVEEIWQRVLKSIQFTTLEDLVQGQGKLVSLLVCKGNAGAIAHVEFKHHQQNSKMESLEMSISNALQEALGCPVELKIILAPLSCENNSSEEGTNVISYSPKDTSYCQESKLKSCKPNLIRRIAVLARKHIKWNKRRDIGFSFNCVSYPNSSCVCVSVWNVNTGYHV